jgi:D-serine deaminase-like pyridoxal phosphate-dependent protein
MSMPSLYDVDNLDEIPSPAAILFLDLVQQNLQGMIRIARGPNRLRPHCKTHKLREIILLERQLGIERHKCATIAEAEMLAGAGVRDILLAYNIVGPNIGRVVRLRQAFPEATLSVTADDPLPLTRLNEAMSAADQQIEVMVDIDSGMRRTGLADDARAESRYELIARLPGVMPGGIHLYDGQNHQRSMDQRRAAVLAVWQRGSELRDRLLARGMPVPRIVAGGTGSFPVFAELDDPALQLSPGTTVLHDQGYVEMFPDLDFTPALLVLTRVISRPAANLLTLDAGNKAIAADPPEGTRTFFPALTQARELLHNEEHLVLETPEADRFRPGDALLAIPRHVCPTTALHEQVYVVRDGHWCDVWQVDARKRILTI